MSMKINQREQTMQRKVLITIYLIYQKYINQEYLMLWKNKNNYKKYFNQMIEVITGHNISENKN